jgi:hypothetical protein
MHVIREDGLSVHMYAGATCCINNAVYYDRHVILANLTNPPPGVPGDVGIESARPVAVATHRAASR